MSKFHDCIFLELTQAFCKHHQRIQNDMQIYTELKNMKQTETKRVEVYYEWIQKLVHGLQVPTTNNFQTIVFRASLQSYLRIVTTRMKWSTQQQYKEVSMLCEGGMTIAKARNALSVTQNIKHVILTKTQNNARMIDKHCTNCGMTNHNATTCKKKK